MKTEVTELLGIEYPIIQGGMAWVAEYHLAAGVSNAGGLGLIGAASAPAEWVREQIREAKKLTDKPFGVNIMLMSPYADDVARIVAEEGVKVVTTGAGNPEKYMQMWKEAGVKVIPVVASVALARRMERCGADALVAEGCEAGGHIGENTTMVLVPQIVDAVNIPVIAAGGIADGRGMAAAFMLGARGMQLGTHFVVTKESIVHENYKRAIIKARDIDSRVTGRSTGHPVRALRNQMTKEYLRLEQEGASFEELEHLTLGGLRKSVVEGDVANGSVMAGQSAAMVKEECTCKELIERLVRETDALIKGAGFYDTVSVSAKSAGKLSSGRIAFVYPGQGAQKCGMGADFYEHSKAASELFDMAGELLNIDMKALCFQENDKLDQTEYTQAALVTACLAMTRALTERGLKPDVTAGLSLGEYCAVSAAGGMSETDAIRTVRERGILMERAVPAGEGAMAAVLGMTGEAVLEVIENRKGVSIANFNCPGQIVITGESKAVEEAAAALKEAGAKRTVMLNVSGPFHSSMMRPAGEALAQVLEQVELSELRIPYVTNVTAEYVTDVRETKELLARQVSASVRWQESIERMIADGVDTFVEIGPGKTLAGFMKKINRDVRMYNVGTWEDIEKVAAELLV